MSSNREELLGRRAGIAGQSLSSDYGATGHVALEAQRTAMRQQDTQLEELSTGVSGIRSIAGLLSAEVLQQNRLLDDIALDVEAADGRVQGATRRTAATEKSPYTIHNFCMLLWPLVLLIVFMIVGLKRFVFG
jgi:hypothetical protein